MRSSERDTCFVYTHPSGFVMPKAGRGKSVVSCTVHIAASRPDVSISQSLARPRQHAASPVPPSGTCQSPGKAAAASELSPGPPAQEDTSCPVSPPGPDPCTSPGQNLPRGDALGGNTGLRSARSPPPVLHPPSAGLTGPRSCRGGGRCFRRNPEKKERKTPKLTTTTERTKCQGNVSSPSPCLHQRGLSSPGKPGSGLLSFQAFMDDLCEWHGSTGWC